MLQRCPKGTKRNKQSGLCEPTQLAAVPLPPPPPQLVAVQTKRCPTGTRRNKKTGLCEPAQLAAVSPPPPPTQLVAVQTKRCPTGTRRNKKTGLCEPSNQIIPTQPTIAPAPVVQKRCPKGSKKNKKTGLCEKIRGKTIKNTATENVTPETNEANKALIIQNFMKRTKYARKALFLKTICSDSGVCIAFGKESESIKKFFNNFVRFDYVTGLKRIGVPSVNGVITEITYKHRDYLAHAILKSSTRASADNLMYEYNVGNVLNKYIRLIPIFVETYGYYFYKDLTDLNKIKNNTATIQDLKTGLELQENYDYEKSCVDPMLTSVLIQHIKNAKTLEEMLSDPIFLREELLYCLYQVYYALYQMRKRFTHYDLHTSNVLLYEPVNGKYIQYHYHKAYRATISFKSKYIVKIIDYGRSFVRTPTTNISKNIYDAVCAIPKCNVGGACGKNKGYSWLNPTNPMFLISSIRNESFDLRLLHILKTRHINNIRLHNEHLANTIINTTFGVGVSSSYTNYGTIENLFSGYSKNAINNVQDAEWVLEDVIRFSHITARNNNFYNSLSDKIGDLHIRFTSDMEFIPNT